jgi:phosphoadenosine phosphosulfate reductase
MNDRAGWRRSIAESYAAEGARGAIKASVCRRDRPRGAVLTSFGVESAVLLKLVADVAPAAPVVFLETGKHFLETLRYADRLIQLLGLQDVRHIKPEQNTLRKADAEGDLWRRDPDRCCFLRKVEPLHRALYDFEGYISGRKRFQSAGRSNIDLTETVDDKIQINPLFDWDQNDIENAMRKWGLPPHPLQAKGYTSVGCMPCTTAPTSGNDIREGRWAFFEKTECGIHDLYFEQLAKTCATSWTK